MTSIEIQKLSRTQKNYLKNLFNYKFESLFQLLFELFDSHKHGHKEIFEIEALLTEIGYNNLEEIPKSETEVMKTIIRSKLQEWGGKSDSEYLSYELMSQIQSKNIIVILDNIVIEHIENPIIINPNSVISFINNSKMDSITFTTL
ncbi:hypothetical protein [Flavobacterium hercynium]|uniref:Uncharacterized protein n=1 Tax=Flavobacterium hercynium TaxID=387094 RepID=A0A226H019_9FLAO|nr:hypothetical protein [Flavobacterium hercynium]OXA87647.1 hypothetical protein B0A66_16050 [Flavobacterium hercynium]SMP11028.1 hypothetical protein SAMN06265346_10366 [Flavobacterium hercynium]